MSAALRDACAYCLRREHLRRTTRIALAVGIVLTAINQLDVILGGDATAATWIKCGLNFVVPFVVSNLGLLSGRDSRAGVLQPGRRALDAEPQPSETLQPNRRNRPA